MRILLIGDIFGEFGRLAIEENLPKLIKEHGNSSVNNVIKCKITYNIGCIMNVSEGKIFSIYGEEGVEYVDIVTLVPSQDAYYVDSKNFVLVIYL